MFRLILLLLFIASPASAHGSAEQGGLEWTLDPWLTIPLGLLLLIYVVGAARLRQRAERSRPHQLRFLAGWAVLTLALISPLHAAGERSFTLHMIEHELIMLVATLLLAASRAGGALAWGLPKALRQGLGGAWRVPVSRLWRRLTDPVTATIVQGAVMWLWHMPALFDRALDHRGWHIAQHFCFVAASFLFWVAMLGGRERHRFGTAAACLFVTSMIGGALGALMTFSNSPWYAPYARMGMSGLGLDPVADQQIAGLVMWIPGGLVHAGAALYCFYRWISRAGARTATA
ncbi:MAG: cytochrome c oxidase assembly protein [Sphingomonadales bacterium]|nr:cytochrome c oxidase assembly protein [Sphingomonadales bacterium]